MWQLFDRWICPLICSKNQEVADKRGRGISREWCCTVSYDWRVAYIKCLGNLWKKHFQIRLSLFLLYRMPRKSTCDVISYFVTLCIHTHTLTHTHTSIYISVCVCESKLLCVWVKITLCLSQNFYVCESRLLRVWVKVTMCVNQNYYVCESKLLCVWVKITLCLSQNYYVCESKLLCVWVKISVCVSQDYSVFG